MSCIAAIPVCGRGARPEITNTGLRETKALDIAVTALVSPGPAVTMATPRSPVSSALACAMYTAAAS